MYSKVGVDVVAELATRSSFGAHRTREQAAPCRGAIRPVSTTAVRVRVDAGPQRTAALIHRKKDTITTAPSARTSPRDVATVAVLTLTALLAVGQTYVILGVLDTLARDLGVSAETVSSATAVFGIAYAAGFLLAGPLAARFGARTVLLVGLAAAAVATLAAAAPTSIDGMLTARVAQGIFIAAFAPCALVYVSQRMTPRLRAFATTALTTAFLASAVVMPMVAHPIGEKLGWRTVFVASAAALGLCAILLAVLLDRRAPEPVPIARAFMVLPRVLGRWRMLALFGATAAVLASYVAFFTVIQLASPPSVSDFPGSLQGLRAATLPAFGVVMLIAGVLYRLPPIARIIGGLLLAAAATVGAGTGRSDTLVLGLAAAVFVGAIAVAAPAIVARVVQASASDETAGATALYGAFMFLGGSLGTVVATWSAPSGFGVAMPVIAAIAALGSALVVVSGVRRGGAPRPV